MIFAIAKRRLQAAIRRTSSIINRRSLSGYAVLFEDMIPGEFLASIDPTERQRSFGHIPVFRAWLAQIPESNASCQKAVALIQSWCRVSKPPAPSTDTSSYCKARCRLRLSFLQQIHQRIITDPSGRISIRDQWNGFTLKAMDGSNPLHDIDPFFISIDAQTRVFNGTSPSKFMHDSDPAEHALRKLDAHLINDEGKPHH